MRTSRHNDGLAGANFGSASPPSPPTKKLTPLILSADKSQAYHPYATISLVSSRPLLQLPSKPWLSPKGDLYISAGAGDTYEQYSSGARALAFPAHRQCVAAQPVGAHRAALGVVELASVAEAAVFDAGRGLAPQLAVLVHRVADPVDLGVVPDPLRAGGVSEDPSSHRTPVTPIHRRPRQGGHVTEWEHPD